MRLSEQLVRTIGYTPPMMGSLVPLESAKNRILARWPDVVGEVQETEREALIQNVKKRLVSGQWDGTRLSVVIKAAVIVFEEEFRENRPDLQDIRDFYIEETRISTRPTFQAAMFLAYRNTYVPGAPHTILLARALEFAEERLGGKEKFLIRHFPRVLDHLKALSDIAERMLEMSCPWTELKAMGISSPHAPGLMNFAHLTYLKLIEKDLHQKETLERLFDWLKPEGRAVKSSHAAEALDAILKPWLSENCSDSLRVLIVERLLALYGDPRVSGKVCWAGVSSPQRNLMLRWLTRADMQFFIDVVTDTQDSDMWPPRRDYWLKLYQQGRIDAAWVAFCDSAGRYAERRAGNGKQLRPEERFGRQIAKGTRANTSLLIMQIGTKIVVDGCHSYKTHIFNQTDRSSPQLYQRSYDCEAIRMISTRSKPHNSIGVWKEWVERNI